MYILTLSGDESEYRRISDIPCETVSDVTAHRDRGRRCIQGYRAAIRHELRSM